MRILLALCAVVLLSGCATTQHGIRSQVDTIYGMQVKTPGLGTVLPPLCIQIGLIRTEELSMRGSNSFSSATGTQGRFWPSSVSRTITASCSDVISATPATPQ